MQAPLILHWNLPTLQRLLVTRGDDVDGGEGIGGGADVDVGTDGVVVESGTVKATIIITMNYQGQSYGDNVIYTQKHKLTQHLHLFSNPVMISPHVHIHTGKVGIELLPA